MTIQVKVINTQHQFSTLSLVDGSSLVVKSGDTVKLLSKDNFQAVRKGNDLIVKNAKGEQFVLKDYYINAQNVDEERLFSLKEESGETKALFSADLSDQVKLAELDTAVVSDAASAGQVGNNASAVNSGGTAAGGAGGISTGMAMAGIGALAAGGVAVASSGSSSSTSSQVEKPSSLANIIADVNNAPVITSGDTAIVEENSSGIAYQASATDLDGDKITYSLSGLDANWFNINPLTGAVSFRNKPDYEENRPSDLGNPPDGLVYVRAPELDNTYEINVIATDGKAITQKAVTVTVTNVNEAPIISSGSAATVAENTTDTVYQVRAYDPDQQYPWLLNNLTYSLGGVDADWFNIDAQTGAVSFKHAPDYEAHRPPTDGSDFIQIYPFIDNTYDINVIASDGTLSTEKAVTIAVTNVDEPVYSDIVLLGNPIFGTEGNDKFDGTAGIDYIYGFGGDDVFNNSPGRDVLTGGSGRDTFNFELGWMQSGDLMRYGFDPNSIDTIFDFVSGEDTIGFKGDFIQTASSLRLSDDMLVQGPGAVARDANDWFIFDSNNGALYFDADGNGAGAAQQFATLYEVTSLVASDIVTYASDVIL